jgi:HEAT repeat protein
MTPIDLGPLYSAMLSNDAKITRAAVTDLAQNLDSLDPSQVSEAVEIMTSLFYIDLGDKPQYVGVVEDVVSTVAAIGEKAIPTLMTLMCDSDLKATLMFGRTLGRIGPSAYGPLKDLFYRAQTPHQRVLALFALAKMHEAALMEIFPDLVTALDDSDREVRDTAARTIGRVVDAFRPGQLPHDHVSAAFERLIFRLTDSSPVVRFKVVRTIGKLAKNQYLEKEQLESATNAIKSLLGMDGGEADPMYMVRREAEEALMRFELAEAKIPAE